jgi:hypothetical protein
MSSKRVPACRAVSRQRLAKHVPAATNQRATIDILLETGCFYVVHAEELWGRQLGKPSQFCTGGCEERTSVRESSPLLEAVARNGWWRNSRLEKGLAGAVVICELWRLAVALYLLVVPSRVDKWLINPFTNPYPVDNHPYTLQYNKVAATNHIRIVVTDIIIMNIVIFNWERTATIVKTPYKYVSQEMEASTNNKRKILSRSIKTARYWLMTSRSHVAI